MSGPPAALARRISSLTAWSGPDGHVFVAMEEAEAALVQPSFEPEHADDLLVVSGFVRRPGPELRVVSLDAAQILAA